MSEVDKLYLVVGAVVLSLSMSARTIKERLWISEPLAAMAIGAALGPIGFGLVTLPGSHDSGLSAIARLTVAMSVAGVALRLPPTYVRRRWRTVLVMLAVVMPLMWAIASGAAWAFLGFSALPALWLGAAVTPTDPVLSDTVVTGDLAEREIDSEVRHLISFESGANDGLAFLLIMVPLSLADRSFAAAGEHWLFSALLGDVIAAIAVGATVGFLTGKAMRAVLDRELTTPTAVLAANASLVLLLLGASRLIGTDGLIAVFSGALALNWLIREEEGPRHREVQEVITRFFDAPVFILFGIALPLSAWRTLGWPLYGFAVAVLLLRRLPAIFVARPLLPPIRSLRRVLFVGWFGPVGAAALVYATAARRLEGGDSIWTAASLVVCLSVLVHGVTATPFTYWFARAGRTSIEGAST